MNKQQNRGKKEKIKLVNATNKAIKQPPVKQPPAYIPHLPPNNLANLAKRSHEPKVSNRSHEPNENKWIKWILLGVILVITFISFSAALRNDFINWDESVYVVDNTDLARPIMEGVKYFFGLHYFVGNYTPLTMIIYSLEYHLGGIDPELYHAVNVAIHLLNVMLVFWFIYLLSGKKLEVAAIVSLFFGIHPMHVESVAWVAELKDVLYSFFFIGALITYYKYIQSSKSKVIHYSLTFVLFVISVLSKPAAVIFPIVLLLLDFYTKRKFDKYVWLEKLPFFIVSFILGIITMKAQQQAHAISQPFTIPQMFMFTSYSILGYIVKLLLPINLSAIYSYPHFVNGHLPYIYYITPFIVLLVFYGVYMTFRYSRLILFGFLFYLINIALVLQVITIGDAIMADRYTYIPYIGLLFVIAMGFSRVYNSKEQKLSVYKLPAIILIIILTITSSYLTYARTKIWKDGGTLWSDVLNKFPEAPYALNNKGAFLVRKGQYEEALKLCTKAIQCKPDYGLAYMNLADCYHALHDYDNELKNINIGLKYEPDNYKALNNEGAILFAQGKYKEAIKVYNEAIQLNSGFADTYINLANSYKSLKDYDNALKSIDIGLRYAPQNPIVLNNKGCILFAEGKYKDAIEVFEEIIKLNPHYADAYMNIGTSYGMLQDYDKAIVYWKKSLEYNPNNAGIYKFLGWGYQNKGDKVSADAYFAKAKQLEKQ